MYFIEFQTIDANKCQKTHNNKQIAANVSKQKWHTKWKFMNKSKNIIEIKSIDVYYNIWSWTGCILPIVFLNKQKKTQA